MAGRPIQTRSLKKKFHFCLSINILPLVAPTWTPVQRLYERRELYKGAGADYDGARKQWSMPPGSNLRRIIMLHPDWLEDAAMLQRRIILKMMEELEGHPVIS